MNPTALWALIVVVVGVIVWFALPPKDEWSYRGSSDRKISGDLTTIRQRIAAMRALENMNDEQ